MKIVIILIIAAVVLTGCDSVDDGFDLPDTEVKDMDASEPIADGSKTEYQYVEEHITDAYCDALHECPEGLSCWSLPGKGLYCVDPDPCGWFCGQTNCIVLESYPPQLRCD